MQRRCNHYLLFGHVVAVFLCVLALYAVLVVFDVYTLCFGIGLLFVAVLPLVTAFNTVPVLPQSRQAQVFLYDDFVTTPSAQSPAYIGICRDTDMFHSE